MKKKNERRIAMLLTIMMLVMNLIVSPVWAAPGDVAINKDNFPDANFRSYVSIYFDKDSNGVLSQDELDAVKDINVNEKNITTLEGVEYFTELKYLYCQVNQLRALDVTKNPKLIDLFCGDNQLTALNVTKNPELVQLRCGSNQLRALDVTNNPELKVISCIMNELTALDVTKNSKLVGLNCSYNKLTALNVTKNPKLKNLYCVSNKLTSLDLNANTNITEFSGNDQKYDIAVDKNMMTFDLKSLPGDFDPLKASEWKGGTVSGNTLTLNDADTNEVTYKYEARSDKFIEVTLKVKNKRQITISFDPGDGSGSMADVTINAGETYVLPECGFTAPAGKEFKYWKVGGAGKAVGDSIIVNADTKVKALWKDKTSGTYTVTFDKNGGSGSMAEVTKNAGETYVLPACGFTAPTGKEFKAWEVGGVEKAVGDSITVNTDTKVKALWKDKAVVAINEANFPDANFRSYVSTNFDKDSNGVLSQDELDAVKEIEVSKKNITTLEGVEHFAKLEFLYCNDNQLRALDVTKNPKLLNLDCRSNQLRALDVTKNPKLVNLYCASNQLTALDVTNNPELRRMSCIRNKLTALNVTKNPELKELYCSYNKLTALDVTKNPELNNLTCDSNQLTVLDVTKNLELRYLWCNDNQLTSLDLTANINITKFNGSRQEYNIEVSKSDLTFDLSSLPRRFDPLKASEWKGGTVSGNTLTLNDADTNEVTYKYEARSDKFLEVTLKVKNKVQITISFDPGDGSGSMADVTKNAGETYVLPACAFTAPTGKEFKAWEVGGVEKAVGDSITVNANTKVKALWKGKTPETYTVTFDSNGGSGSMADVKVDKGSMYSLPACKFTAPTGKEFKAWEVGGVEKAVGDSITVNADTKVKALWKDKTPETYTVTFDKNGGSGSMAAVTKNAGETYVLPACAFTAPPGKEFKAWEVEGVEKAVGDSITVNANTKVKALWKDKTPETYTVTFDKNGGSGSMADVKVDKGSMYSLPACKFTAPTGKEFKAWEVGGVEKAVGDSITVSGNITVKAVWKDIGSLPPTPPVPPTPDKPYPWTVYPGWYYNFETPKPKEEKPVSKMEMEWKIQLTIGKDLLHKEINGVESNIKMDIAPYIKDGRTMLPLRFVAEALGFDVEWIGSTRTVVLKQDKMRVEIPVDTDKIIVNGKVYTSDVKPEIKKDRTMLSIANIARALGLQDGKDIFWDNNTKTVTINRYILVK